MRKPLKEARPPLLDDRKTKMKRARSPSITSSPIPQLDGTYAPSTLQPNLLSRLKDTEESKPKSAPKHEPDPEYAPEPETESVFKHEPDPESAPEPEPETESAPEPETEAGPGSETELEM